LQSSKIPIVVGGTNYYIESILWHNLVSPGIGKRKIDALVCEDLSGMTAEVKELIESSSIINKMEEMDSTKLYEYLQQIDPTMANRLHPNNKRKIMR
jgi:tRNA dimethylallyltransferase